MKVIIAVNSDIGKQGKIGLRPYFIVKECFQKNYLKKVFCRSILAKDIPMKYFFKSPWIKILSLTTRAINIYFVSHSLQVKIQNIFYKIFDHYVKKHLSQCDIFHSWDLLPNSFKKAKIQKSINLLDIQMAPLEYINNEVRLYQKTEFLKYSNLIDYFIVPSLFVKNVLQELGIIDKKIIYIPFGVDINKFFPVFSKKQKFICLFVGLLSKRKGVHHLLQAWKELELKNAELVLCGRKTKEFQKIFKEYRNIKNIKLKGYLYGDALVQEYQQASVFILPSLIEGSAKATYEAMACGLPLITTPNAGSVARDNCDGFIIPTGNVEILKEKIKYFYDNPSKVKQMGENARQEITKYTWEIYGKKIVELYEKIYYER